MAILDPHGTGGREGADLEASVTTSLGSSYIFQSAPSAPVCAVGAGAAAAAPVASAGQTTSHAEKGEGSCVAMQALSVLTLALPQFSSANAGRGTGGQQNSRHR